MSERTALEVAAILEDSMPICGRAAVKALRQQHDKIERLTALNSALTAERDIVIAVAAAERETCARICETSSSLEEAAHLIRARSAK
jgi:hypothetical protein